MGGFGIQPSAPSGWLDSPGSAELDPGTANGLGGSARGPPGRVGGRPGRSRWPPGTPDGWASFSKWPPVPGNGCWSKGTGGQRPLTMSANADVAKAPAPLSARPERPGRSRAGSGCALHSRSEFGLTLPARRRRRSLVRSRGKGAGFHRFSASGARKRVFEWRSPVPESHSAPGVFVVPEGAVGTTKDTKGAHLSLLHAA